MQKVINRKPYVVMTKEGDYFFSNKKQAQCFARKRCGFFDYTYRQIVLEQKRNKLKEVM